MQVSTEYRKGVLFIRLNGRIDNEGYLINSIKDLINYFGIKYIVLNLNNLNYISLESIDHIIKYHNEILKEKKHLLICDSNKGRIGVFKKVDIKINSELEAFSLI